MSETDARLSFERHATSKIRKAIDLFSIQTLGFRGEALASIAAVAEVTLKTRHKLLDLGTEININGSYITGQEPVSCPSGSNFTVRNLFYNIPARRKFLKSNHTEFRHIITEFQRITLAHPEIEFTLSHNDSEFYYLPHENLRQRIVKLFGKPINQHLVDIRTETSIVSARNPSSRPSLETLETQGQLPDISTRPELRQNAEAFEAELLAAIFDPARPGSLRATADQLQRLAMHVRDRTSNDMWRVLSTLNDRLASPPKRPVMLAGDARQC